ncbi:MAG: hypothetical protein ACREYF_20880 [Gammaproteobacteria bacterium]
MARDALSGRELLASSRQARALTRAFAEVAALGLAFIQGTAMGMV